MKTFLAIVIGLVKGIAALVVEFPWLKFVGVVFVTFFVGCLYGRRMKAEAPPVRVLQPERVRILPRLREEPTAVPTLAPPLEPVPDEISTPTLPDAAETFTQPQAPAAAASACKPGQACYRPQASRQSSRVGVFGFRRWR
jgi:hypothetical protein